MILDKWKTSVKQHKYTTFKPLVPNEEYAASQDAGFSSQMTQHTRWPIMAIPVQPCLGFPLFCLFFYFYVISELARKKIKYRNLNCGVLQIALGIQFCVQRINTTLFHYMYSSYNSDHALVLCNAVIYSSFWTLCHTVLPAITFYCRH
jgi:hypothetical protein